MSTSRMHSDRNSQGDATRPFADPRVIEFRPRRQASPAPVIDPLRQLEIADDRRRMLQNAAAAVVVIVLTAVGMWLIEELRQSCIEADHNCVVRDTPKQ